jgi:hypothetical protein
MLDLRKQIRHVKGDLDKDPNFNRMVES